MSTTDPRRDDDGRLHEPAPATAADTTDRRGDADATDRRFDDVVADRHDEDGRRAEGAAPDGAIRDSERDGADRAASRDDADTGSTRVLPAAGDRGRASSATDTGTDRRAADEQRTVAAPVVTAPAPGERSAETVTERPMSPRSVLAREKEQFGGMRFLLAFFGWLTATGLAVLLGAIAGGILTAVGNSNGSAASTSGLQSLGIAGAIVTAVILFVAYYAGGYVAGRMARFDGAKQGVAVWLWAILITILAAIAGAIGSQFGLFSQVGSIAQVPINGQTLTVVGLVGIIAALALSLLGAVLGGLAGMRFHRKVDRAAFGA